MKEFEITITETLEKKITVEALSKDEAEQAARDMWNDADIILDAEDFIDVDFKTDDGKEADRSLDVLLVKPGEYPQMATIKGGLESLQAVVGGSIEAAYYFDDPVALVCNEEGKLCGMPLNRAIRDEKGQPFEIIAGTFFICGLGEEDFTSLPKELQKKYEDKFKQPETFLRMGRGKIMAIPYDSDKEAKSKPPKTAAHEER